MGDYAQNDFDALYRNRYDYLLRLACRSTKNYHDSEDLVDEAFVVYLQKSATIHISNLKVYLRIQCITKFVWAKIMKPYYCT